MKPIEQLEEFEAQEIYPHFHDTKELLLEHIVKKLNEIITFINDELISDDIEII